MVDLARADTLARGLSRGRLTWWPELGTGYYPVTAGEAVYDAEYFARFARQADSDIGRALMRARVDFVARHWPGTLVDVGIGSGAFILARGDATYGWDVNPAALAWLAARQLALNPYDWKVAAISLWNVLEHIADFRPLLANVQDWVFVSIPIFSGPDHVLRSKHYRKDEHYWYFTRPALIAVMASLGFECREINTIETDLGREDIESFAFKRRA